MRDEALIGADDHPGDLGSCVFLVAGMHRSGTSALTRVVNLLGAALPPNLMPANDAANAKGFWESLDVVALNDRILDSINSDWDDCMAVPPDWFASPAADLARENVLDALKEYRAADHPLVVKDPRICRLLPVWLDAARRLPAKPLVLITVRHPQEVAGSLHSRDGMNEVTALYLWLRHVIDAERWSRGERRAFVRFDDLLTDWRKTVADAARALDVTWPTSPDAVAPDVEEFLDSALRRHVETAPQLAGRTEIHALCETAWQWVRSDRRDESTAVLDDIAERLRKIEDVAGQLASALRLKVRRARDAERESRDAGAVLHEHLEQSQKDLRAHVELTQKLQADNDSLGQQVANALTIARSQEQQLAAARETERASAARIQHLEKELAKVQKAGADANAHLEKELAEVRKAGADAIASLEKELGTTRQAHADAVAHWKALDARIAELERDLAALHEAERAAERAAERERAERARTDRAAAAVSRRQVDERRERLGKSLLEAARPPRRLKKPKGAAVLRGSALFDGGWYLQRYREAAESGMDPVDHYLLHGAAVGFDPHPLFSTSWYLDRNPDIAENGMNPLVHYITHGGAERRDPHPLFDSRFYTETYPDAAAAVESSLEHYLRTGGKAGYRPCWLFDPEAYVAACPDAGEGRRTPLEHYVLQGAGCLLQPHWAFDAEFYLRDNLVALNSGMTPLEHFARTWTQTLRDPNPTFDIAAYLEEHEEVRRNGENPLAHFVRGYDAGRVLQGAQARPARPTPSTDSAPAAPEPGFVELLTTEFGETACAATVELMRRFRLPFTTTKRRPAPPDAAERAEWVAEIERLDAARDRSDEPDVSIIIPVYNQLTFTLACIRSVLEWPSRYSYEIIVGDDCSTDGTGELFAAGVGSVRHVRGETNRGFIGNCNAAAAESRGRYLVFLNNDTVVLPGWLDEMIGTLESDSSIGLAGAKLLYPDGTLQECGGILWRNGSAWNFGRHDDPRKPEYGYLRDVDYVSGASIAVPRALWRKLGGFDTHYDIAYGEDSDLALKIRYRENKRVVVQPLSQLVHFEGISSGTDETAGVKAYQVGNARKLTERWQAELQGHRPNGERPELEKERPVGKRVLVIDHCTPTPDQDAGSLTCFEIMRAFQANGYKVTFIPETNFLWLPKESRDLQRIGIEAVYTPHFKTVKQYLKTYGPLFDDVVIFRNGAASRNMAHVRRLAPQAKLIFHTSDLHFLREKRRAELSDGGRRAHAVAKKSRKRELDIIAAADLTIVHSTYEREILADLVPSAEVFVFPWILDTYGRRKPFDARSGVIFLGGYGHPPNVDAVQYFVAEIWPAVRRELPDITFYAAGANPPEALRALDGRDGVVVTGFIPDLGDYFDVARLSVAPIRYGAGIKGKIAVSLSYGVPCIATACAAEGMELTDGENVVIADSPAEMAREIVALYHDEARWAALSDAGLKFVDDTYARDLGTRRVGEIVRRVRSAAAAPRDTAGGARMTAP